MVTERYAPDSCGRERSSSPLVTVGITTFNRSDILPTAIDSVLAQTYVNFELFIIDDHSSDATREVAATYSDARVTYLYNDRNAGVSASRNRVLSNALGAYIAYLDDDDLWLPEKLELQVNLAETQSADCAVICCGCTVENDRREILNVIAPSVRGRVRSYISTGRLSTIPSSHLFRTKLLRTVGGYDTSLRNHEEHDVWMNLAKYDFKADYVDAPPLVTARAHLGYRLTADVNARWLATDQYLSKWRDHLVSWMGLPHATRYEQAYRVRVMSSVAREAIRRRNYEGLSQAFLFLIRRWPKELKTRSIILFANFLIGGVAVDRFPWLRKLSTPGAR